MTLTFGKFKGQKLENTPNWYQDWLNKQDWFIKKFKNSVHDDTMFKMAQSISRGLKGWDGYSARGQAAYDQMFEFEKMLDSLNPYECECGCQKFEEDKYCEGDHCKYDLAYVY